MNQVLLQFGDIKPFLQRYEDERASTMAKMLAIIQNQSHLRWSWHVWLMLACTLSMEHIDWREIAMKKFSKSEMLFVPDTTQIYKHLLDRHFQAIVVYSNSG